MVNIIAAGQASERSQEIQVKISNIETRNKQVKKQNR